MSDNINNQRNSPATDPYAYYRPAPESYKKPKSIAIPKILIPFILAGLGTFFVFCWVPPRSIIAFHLSRYGIPYFAFLAGVGAIALLASCAWLKSKIVAGSPKDLRIVTATLNDFPGVDFSEFERYTAELQKLGFLYQSDYRTHTAKIQHPKGIARVLVNPELRCIAEINQLGHQGKILRVHCNFISYSLRQKDGRTAIQWMLSTTNREMMSTGNAIRHPWSYGNSIVGAGPVQLLESHLSRRAKLIGETGLQVANDVSCETFFTLMQQSIEDRRKMLKRKNILLFLLKIDLFEFRPRSEWAGKPASN